MCDKRDRAITCVFRRDLHLTLIISGLLQKDLFKGRWSLAERFFKQYYLDVTFVNTRFAVFFPLPSCCVSSPLLGPRTLLHMVSLVTVEWHYYKSINTPDTGYLNQNSPAKYSAKSKVFVNILDLSVTFFHDMRIWKIDARLEISLCSSSPLLGGGGSSQTLCGAVWEEFITRPTTMVELDLQLHMLKEGTKVGYLINIIMALSLLLLLSVYRRKLRF